MILLVILPVNSEPRYLNSCRYILFKLIIFNFYLFILIICYEFCFLLIYEYFHSHSLRCDYYFLGYLKQDHLHLHPHTYEKSKLCVSNCNVHFLCGFFCVHCTSLSIDNVAIRYCYQCHQSG